ncbi:KdsC family phosphatase [Halocola ammonii]
MTSELPKLVITDIDGVWTDGGMYYDQTGNEWKKFNTGDSAGVLYLKKLDIPLAIITGEDTQIVKRRAEKLGIDRLHMGVKDKVSVAEGIRKELNIQWDEIAFIGDDLGDYLLLQKVGISGAPSSAPEFIRSTVKTITTKKGGEGAFREFVEILIRSNVNFEDFLKTLIV